MTHHGRRSRLVTIALALATCLAGARCDEQGPAPAPPLEPEEIDTACALIVSCLPPASESASDCATAALTRPATGRRLTREWLDCLAAAGARCDAVNACAPAIDGDPCAAMPEGVTCQGDILVSCFGGHLEFVTDCSAWGLACDDLTGEPVCRGTGSSCLEGDESCDGQTAAMCLGFAEERFDCGSLVEGRVCEERSGLATCVPGTQDCDPATHADSCDGTSLVFCSASGQETRLDCTLLGFSTCAPEGDRAICGE
jgi:hypothetical protein